MGSCGVPANSKNCKTQPFSRAASKFSPSLPERDGGTAAAPSGIEFRLNCSRQAMHRSAPSGRPWVNARSRPPRQSSTPMQPRRAHLPASARAGEEDVSATTCRVRRKRLAMWVQMHLSPTRRAASAPRQTCCPVASGQEPWTHSAHPKLSFHCGDWKATEQASRSRGGECMAQKPNSRVALRRKTRKG